MKSLKVNDTLTVNGLERKIISIRWKHPKTDEVSEKNEVLFPALYWCILKTDKGELIRIEHLEHKDELILLSYARNGIYIKSNQYGFSPCKTYWYIINKMGEIFHHKDSKWRKKELKEITTYYFTAPESALKMINKLEIQ